MTPKAISDVNRSERIERDLRRSAAEIRAEGRNGWGNVCEEAADLVARLRVDALMPALQRAAENLPHGFHIEICVENGAAWVDLFDADYIGVEFPRDDRTLTEQVNEAIDAATAPKQVADSSGRAEEEK